ncbi:serine/threonine protein kinase [Synergistales bacterium]|nr:serine/threonine protein kinase [Synergistales bacterium]
MKSFLCSVLMIAFLALAVSPAFAGTQNAARAVNEFAIDLYRQIEGEAKGNIFFSPFSVSSALAMVYAGAANDTEREMAETLHFNPEIHVSMKDMSARFSKISGKEGVLETANRVWVSLEEDLLPSYAELLERDYASGAERLDFKTAPKRSLEKINAWVSEKTQDKIKDLLQENDVTADTRFVLTNALYFKAPWIKQFSEGQTKTEPFYTEDGEKDAQLMRVTDHFLYGSAPDVTFVKIGYRLRGLSMMILLPNKSSSVDALSKKLSYQLLSEWSESMKSKNVRLVIPKFKAELRYPLSDILQKLGMKLAFTREADFSGMVANPRNKDGVLYVDTVIHKSFIEVDEKGTEAAAATAVAIARTSAAIKPEEITEFRADRPFMYCIMDDVTGAVLFMGRLSAP